MPHLAMLSYGEVVAAGQSLLRLATYRGSSTTANLQRTAHVTFCLIAGGAAYYIKGSAMEQAGLPSLQSIVIFEVAVTSVLEDRERGMPLTSGVTFACEAGEEALLVRWQPVVTALRALGTTGT